MSDPGSRRFRVVAAGALLFASFAPAVATAAPELPSVATVEQDPGSPPAGPADPPPQPAPQPPPTEAPPRPVQPPAEPTQPVQPAQPTQPPAEPTQPVQPPAEPTQPPAQPTQPAQPTPAQPVDPPVEAPPPGSDPASPASGTIDEAVWSAMLERRVTVETPTQTVTGRLVSVGDGADGAAVLVRDDGEVVSVSKREATRIRIAAEDPAATPPGDPEPTPPSADGDEVADAPDDAAAEEPKDHRRLGLFTSHGVGYARFRGPGGGAAYALDVGVGYNTSERFGVYGLIGGHVGARVHEGEGRGHFGHFAVSFRWKWKYFAFMPGLGVGISGIRGPGDSIDRRVGFALPVKMMGMIPLPKELFLGIGLGYDLGILPGRQLFNGIALQVTVGRW